MTAGGGPLPHALMGRRGYLCPVCVRKACALCGEVDLYSVSGGREAPARPSPHMYGTKG